MNENWFEAWFDSPLYEKLYADRDEEEARRLIALLEERLNLNDCSRILDLGCGRGRHSLTLARDGYEVTGIDLSPEAIRKAKEQAATEGLDNAHFRVGDMRDPLPDTFDAVINLFTTFGYFEDDDENEKVLDCIAEMVRSGGIAVIDFFNADKVRNSYEPSDKGAFQGIHYRIRRYIENNAIHKEITFSGDRIEGEKSYTERVKLYGIDWFRPRLQERNMRLEQVFGDYDGGDFETASSPRLLMIARKASEC